MKVLIVGGGGREHAIALKIKENPKVTALYAAPGNGGIAQIATCLPFKATDVDGIVRWAAENKVDFVIVAPDDPLCLGMVDALAEQGIPAFGPRKNAAIIEGSKVFSKNLMKKHGIPTAAYETFDDYDAAVKYLQTADMPIVVKADGLALGKGVLICPDRESAVEAVASMMKEAKFGASGARVVIEEFLTGPEVSVLAFTDGKTVKPMASSMELSTCSMRTFSRGKRLVMFRCSSGSRQSKPQKISMTRHISQFCLFFHCRFVFSIFIFPHMGRAGDGIVSSPALFDFAVIIPRPQSAPSHPSCG